MMVLVRLALIVLLVSGASVAHAQSTDEATEGTSAQLFTQAELENLVAPVALYPDTLLIQVLVAATNPMEVVKADRLLTVSADEDAESLKQAIEAESWDESVEVLAVAFPEVIQDMAVHIEWTESMGNAMLAQSDDVMVAVQTMRTQAINSGALLSGAEQTVEVTQNEDVIIQPADPEVVYVPQYDPEVVYVDSGDSNDNLVGDVITAGLIAFTAFTVIDAVFDDDDDWNNYWGCRNCGGWGGGPIYRNPDIDIDIDGDVNIGNNIIGDGWKPDDRDRDAARDKISDRRDAGGAAKLPVNKSDSRSDALRSKLSEQSGARDISRQDAGANLDAVRKTKGKGDLPNVNRPKASGAINRATPRPAVKKPSAAKNHVTRQSAPALKSRPKATHKKAGGAKARAASKRGKAAGRHRR